MNNNFAIWVFLFFIIYKYLRLKNIKQSAQVTQSGETSSAYVKLRIFQCS